VLRQQFEANARVLPSRRTRFGLREQGEVSSGDARPSWEPFLGCEPESPALTKSKAVRGLESLDQRLLACSSTDAICAHVKASQLAKEALPVVGPLGCKLGGCSPAARGGGGEGNNNHYYRM
jgi:hypothetical protein